MLVEDVVVIEKFSAVVARFELLVIGSDEGLFARQELSELSVILCKVLHQVVLVRDKQVAAAAAAVVLVAAPRVHLQKLHLEVRPGHVAEQLFVTAVLIFAAGALVQAS